MAATKSVAETFERRRDGTRVMTRTVTERVVFSPYGKHAGKTRFAASVARDKFGNVSGPEYDLSPDNTFKGETIAVLQHYTGENFTFDEPTAALRRKGFALLRWTSVPPAAEFEAGLKKSCQLWIISGTTAELPASHVRLIAGLVEARKGLFVWADNDPFTGAANQVLAALPETSGLRLSGNFVADTVLGEATGTKQAPTPGFTKHLTTTGLEQLYEGITVAAIRGPPSQHRVLIRASDGSVITACHDRNKKRILIDGGYTRLMPSRWARTAGTARFVTNAACWLYNHEGKNHKKKKKTQKKRGGGHGGARGGGMP